MELQAALHSLFYLFWTRIGYKGKEKNQVFYKQTAYEIRLYTTAFDVLHLTGIWQPLLPGDAILL